jgi:protein ImuB
VLYSDSPRGGLQVVSCSQRAADKDVSPGMPLAEARGILEKGQKSEVGSQQKPPAFQRHDPRADLAAFRQLAASCQCFSPCCGVEESESPESLLLDITGCEHLFGGEEHLAKQLAQQFDQQGYVARIAIAGTVGAAWASAHYQDSKDLNRRKRSEQRNHPSSCSVTSVSSCSKSITSLQIEALRLPTHIIQTLHELDIRYVAQLQALPRASLASRFGDQVAKRLDQATGHREELITPVQLPQPIEATWSFEEPINDRNTLQAVIRHLLDQITLQLETHQQGVRSLLVYLGTEKRQDSSFTVGLVRPRSSARHLYELIEMQFERLTLPAAVGKVLLRAITTTSLLQRQHNLLRDQESEPDNRDRAALVERLSSRLGEEAVLQPKLYPDAQPEYAFRLEATVGRGQRSEVRSQKNREHSRSDFWTLTTDLSSARPLHIESAPIAIQVVSVISDGPPARFYWQEQDHRVARCWGPERLETGWWRDRHVRRDYYRVETNSGEQFWIFRRLDRGDWFLQGTFA